MGVCDMCGNDYDRSFTITRGDRSGTYDSLECAVTDWAPACGRCHACSIGEVWRESRATLRISATASPSSTGAACAPSVMHPIKHYS